MTPNRPNLTTLLAWAERLAAGQPCAEWEAWRASSPAAAAQWDQIVRARGLLDAGAAVNPQLAIDAEELAELIEGRLDPAAARLVETVCSQSTAQLAEALSAVRFQSRSQHADVSPALRQRLLALAPRPQNGHANGAVVPPPPPPVSRPEAELERRQPLTPPKWSWALTAAAAVLIVASVSATLGWLAATRQFARRGERPVAVAKGELLPQSQPRAEQSDQENPPESTIVPSPPPELPPPTRPTDSPRQDAAPPPSPPSDSAAPSEQPRQRIIVPQQPRTAPPLPPPSRPELVCRSQQGLMLVDVGGTGRWRVFQKPLVLDEPAKIVSLAESWSTIEIPGFGNLVWDGPAEATLAVWPDNMVEIRIAQGKVGIQGMSAGAQVRLETGGAIWTARCLAADSTWGVINDPVAPAMLFVKGSIGVENLTFGPKQVVVWQGGVPEPVPSSNEAAGSLARPVPALGDPWDVSWLEPPDVTRARQWRRLRGPLVARLAAAEDAKEELKKMLATSRDARQAALLAQWSLALVDEASRTQQNWDMLSDRREPVRVAGVKSLLQLPSGDPRQSDLLQRVRQSADAPTGDRVAQWLSGLRQPVLLPPPQAAELADHLQHSDLVVRQLAASILELHTSRVFIQARVLPPVYDAAGPEVLRAAAQKEWRMMLRQFYTAAARNAADANVPIKPLQPAVGPNAVGPNGAPQNAPPGGT